jgi:hypothetical protein
VSFTTWWSPNQASVAQVETYTFSAPNGVGNTYTASINGKSVTYTSVLNDTAALAATGLFNLLTASTSVPAELLEITFANPSSAVVTATARTPGTPFANVPGTSNGLVLSTGNGLNNGIATAHTTPNASPSDVNDAQNWLRVNVTNTPPSKTRALPVNGDDVVVAGTSVPMLWNLDQLAAVQFNTYARWASMQAQIGLPDANLGGYQEWRATRFKFNGPQGSVPAGGLAMVCGQDPDGSGGGGPAFERYDLQSSQWALTVVDGSVDIVGQHTQSTFSVLSGASLAVAEQPGTKANVSGSSVSGGSLVVGAGVTWTGGSTLTVNGGTAVLNAAPSTLTMLNGANVTVAADALTWTTVSAQSNCRMTWLAGGTVTTLTLATGSVLDKSQDARALTITNSTLDGDTCQILDPLNAITFTNATSVKQAVQSGPLQFTGTRTMKVT